MANTKITNPELFNLGDSTSATQLPVMTTTQRIAMTGLSDGEMIFNSTTDKVEYWDGTKWYGITYESTGESPYSAVIWQGTGTTNAITGVGFQPDLIWVKNRDVADSYAIVDSVRGISSPTPYIASDKTDAQATSNNMPTSVQSDGFTVTGGGGRTNTNNEDYVAWCFKAGGAAVSNTDGDLNSNVSANVAGGFSIVKWSGNNSNASIGHGLNSAPEIVIRKNLISAANWAFDTSAVDGSWDYLFLNTTAAKANHSSTTAPTSTTFNTSGTTYNSSSMIAYCFHSVAGYSKVGSFVGTGVAGLKIDLDFEPAYILTKRVSSSGASWSIIDNKRSTGSDKKNYLQANSNAAETTSSTGITFNTDGFTFNGSSFNTNGATHMYMTFA